MKPKTLLQNLRNSAGATVVRFPPDLAVKCGPQDVRAAQLLLWAEEQWPTLSMGDLLKTLQAALWWSTLFGAMHSEAGEVKDDHSDKV